MACHYRDEVRLSFRLSMMLLLLLMLPPAFDQDYDQVSFLRMIN